MKLFKKKLPVTIYGKPVTRMQVFKMKMKRAWHYTKVGSLVTSILAILLLSAFYVGRAYKVGAEEILIDNLPPKIAELKTGVLNQLKDCESKGFKEADAPIILDTNAKMSIGKLMFQINTIISYEKKLYNKLVTRKDAVEIALDEELATNLASEIIFKVGTGNREWVNCFRSKGLQSQVEMIKQLEK